MLFVRAVRVLLVVFAATTLAASSSQARSAGPVLLVGVGGNSECFGADSGMKDVLNRGAPIEGLAYALNVEPSEVVYRYFSWTGEANGGIGCLPGYWDWITGGSGHILDTLNSELGKFPTVVIVGWSNGGATAYELACAMAKTSRRAALLVTLDPASWTTRPCRADASERPLKPARHWIAVYTKSQGRAALDPSNVIALVGHAWNDERFIGTASSLIKLEPGTHGQASCMWRKCVLNDPVLTTWPGGRGRNRYRYERSLEKRAGKVCEPTARCSWQR
jgi:hypothetical protein